VISSTNTLLPGATAACGSAAKRRIAASKWRAPYTRRSQRRARGGTTARTMLIGESSTMGVA
jgi:hypothetical protein